MTQGIVSIMRDGVVLMKIVAGCNGEEAERVGKAVKEIWHEHKPSAEEVYQTAKNIGLGSTDCLVVATTTETIFKGENEDAPTTYQDTLQKPEWNPRWGQGTANHTIIVEV